MDDFVRYTYTMFLSSKDETFEVLEIYSKQIQVKLNRKIIRIEFGKGIEFENAMVEEFCGKN